MCKLSCRFLCLCWKSSAVEITHSWGQKGHCHLSQVDAGTPSYVLLPPSMATCVDLFWSCGRSTKASALGSSYILKSLIFAGGCKQRAKYCCFDELFRVFCRELPSPINASTYGLGGSNYIHVHTQSGLDWLLSLLQTHSVINYNHGSFARHLKIYSRRCISENARVPCIYIVWNV